MVYLVLDLLNRFHALKKSLKTLSEAEYQLTDLTIDNGQEWFIEF